MSYKTPTSTITGLKGIDKKIQDIASHMTELSWLSYSFGLANRDVTFKDGKENIIPTAYQDLNAKDTISMMPSDLYKAFSFWVKEPEAKPDENNVRLQYKISCIFYCDLKQIAPDYNYAVTKSKIRQDILRFFKIHENSGLGQLSLNSIIDDDIVQVYKGFSLSQLDNKFRMLPKYAIRLNFDYSFLIECEDYSLFNLKNGLLYNWYAATDVRNIANTDWHVPTHLENITLSSYINSNGGNLKTIGYDYFQYPNKGATDLYDFNAVGSGGRQANGIFIYKKQYWYAWASIEFAGSPTTGYASFLNFTSNVFYSGYAVGLLKYWGASVRLLKNSTTLSHGQKGTYTGNNGKTYNTICIGTQEWLAENLAETKYRDGSVIPEITDNAAWISLTTGALCAYDNDWNNAI